MSSNQEITDDQARKRRRAVARARAACNVCRLRKLACDAKRPRCTRCVQQNDLSCNYDTQNAEETRNEALKREVEGLKSTLTTIADSFTALRELPPDATARLLLDVASAQNPIMELIDTGRRIHAQREMLDSRISELETAKAVFPSTQSTLEFELNLLHPSAYPPFAMTEHADRLSLQAGIAKAAVGEGSSASLSELLPTGDRLPLDFNITVWTNVPITARLASRAISVFLLTDFALLGHFDPELFLSDLVAERPRFCSRLLVNAFLFYCCLKLTAFEEDAGCLSESFRIESERLWNADQSASALSMAALGFLVAGLLHAGNKPAANSYLASAIQMGHNLNVWGMEVFTPVEQSSTSIEEARMLSFAAWGIFAHAVFWAFRWWDWIPPEPPNLSLSSSSTNKSGVRNILNDFGVNETEDVRSREVFTVLCRDLLVVRVAVIELSRSIRPPRRGLSLDFAELIYKRLLECSDQTRFSLPMNLSSPDYFTVLRMWFHIATMDLFEPFIHVNRSLRGFSASESSPRALYMASLRQLQHMILTYRFRCPFAMATPFWHACIFFVARATATVIRSSESRNMFRLCVLMYADLVVSFPGLLDTFRAMLLLGLQADFLTTEECAGLVENIARRRHTQHATKVNELDILADLKVDDKCDPYDHGLFEVAVGDHATSRLDQ